MLIFERKLLTGSCSKPLVWFRYIDDIFAIWTYGEDKCEDFMLYINSIHSSFRLTCNYSKECVHFFMSQFLWTILVTLRQICMSNLLTRTNIYWLLVVILTILSVAYRIAKLSVFFVFVLTMNQPSYVVRR